MDNYTASIIMNKEELAKYLGVSRRHIQRLQREGLPVIIVGHKTYRYDVEDVVAWLKDRSQKEGYGL